jgi:hypothetical protein
MPDRCANCQGAAEPAAQSRTFLHDGEELQCLAIMSSCSACGYRWEDATYETENLRFRDEACSAAVRRIQLKRGANAPVVRLDRNNTDWRFEA